jgi:hypothetical protein
MPHSISRPTASLILVLCLIAFHGCGTTRSSDTNRTATEQLLISDAIDRAVQSINLQTLAGQSVYLDDSRLGDVVDRNYLVSTLRQHLLANGCSLRAERDQADFIVEARAGAIGTDRNDLLFGVPSINVPQIMPVQPVAAAIPEVPIAKRRDQRGIVKIAVFAYHRETGTPVWQSGIAHQESSANDVWILGAGPFQRGTIYEGTAFAGNTIRGEDGHTGDRIAPHPSTDLARERTYTAPQQLAKQQPVKMVDQGVVPAVHEEAVSEAAEPTSAPATTESFRADPVRVPLPPAILENGNPTRGVVSVQVYNSTFSRAVGALDPQVTFPRPVDPIPLPEPRITPPHP